MRDPLRIEISARLEGGHWGVLGNIPLPLNDGHTPGGGYRYGDITIEVPAGTPDDMPAVRIAPGGEGRPPAGRVDACLPRPAARRATPARIVSIDPAPDGSFFWIDDLTLLFQPAFPGWQRGQQYRVVVDADAAGLAADHSHDVHRRRPAGGGLRHPRRRGRGGAPRTRRSSSSFNRSVAPLTVLQEGPASAVLDFDPPLAGRGEWLNTSLYRFIPTDLAPSTDYAVRIRAGLTAATDGVLTVGLHVGLSRPSSRRSRPSRRTTAPCSLSRTPTSW